MRKTPHAGTLGARTAAIPAVLRRTAYCIWRAARSVRITRHLGLLWTRRSDIIPMYEDWTVPAASWPPGIWRLLLEGARKWRSNANQEDSRVWTLWLWA